MAVKKTEDEGLSLTQNTKVNSVISIVFGAAIILYPQFLNYTIALYLVLTGLLNLLQKKQ